MLIICGNHVQGFGRDISLVLCTSEISLHKHTPHDLHRVITHSFDRAILCLHYLPNPAWLYTISTSIVTIQPKPNEYYQIVKYISNYEYYTLITVIQLCVYIIGCLGLLNHCIESSQCVISHGHRVRIAWRLDVQIREIVYGKTFVIHLKYKCLT